MNAPDNIAPPAADAEALGPAPIAPESPEGFRLGAEPPRVMRLSRKALASIGAVAGIGIGGALLYALQPVAPKDPENLYRADSRNRSETVTGAPADYGSIPKLGPPLPGDLGRPIVSAQANGEVVPLPNMAPPPSSQPDPAEQARQRAEQERDSARASRLFLSGGTATVDGNPPMLAVPVPAGSEPQPADRSAAASRRAFLAESGRRGAESAERIREASSARILQAGSIIPAALITAIHSDLPGQVTAQVTENVYDSPTGRLLLIPQGARLVGEYDSEITAGQKRVLVAWDRLIFSDGRSISLGRMPGGDASGAAGLKDRTDYHFGNMIRAALISTLLGFGTELASNSEDRLARALRGGAQDTANETGRQIVERELGVPPTIRIREGARLRVLVTRDMIVAPANAKEGL